MKPYLLLDIDGVLNLFPSFSSDAQVKRPVARHRAVIERANMQEGVKELAYGVNIPLDAAALIAQLSDHFEIRWYTMWNEHAARVFAPLAGIPDFDYFEADHREGLLALLRRNQGFMRDRLWLAKTPLIPDYVGDRPFVWVDDDTRAIDTDWLQDQGLTQFQIITVEPHSGLTQEVVDLAIAWATTLTHINQEVTAP